MSDIPIIGKPTSIPVDKVMEAMQSLESELHAHYAVEFTFIEDKLEDIKKVINSNHTGSELVELINEILKRERDEVQEKEV